MNDGFKQRLVGAIVLLSLALILWPVIFSDSRPGIDQVSQIPPTPAFKKYTVPELVRPQDIEPIAKPVEQNTGVDPDAVMAETSSKKTTARPVLDPSGLPEAWVLQVASFSLQKNADELKQSLQGKGYKAYTLTVGSGDSLSTRVYIGPRFRKDAFNTDKVTIEKEFSVKSIIVRFQQ
ncbi:MAG: SPOR domain-containing protein [Oceanicoccus sp.]